MLKTSWRCLQFHICFLKNGTPEKNQKPLDCKNQLHHHAMPMKWGEIPHCWTHPSTFVVHAISHCMPITFLLYAHHFPVFHVCTCTDCFHIITCVPFRHLACRSVPFHRAVMTQVIKLKEVIKDKSGKVIKLKCSWTPQLMVDGRGWPICGWSWKMKDDGPKPQIQMLLIY